MNLSKAGGIPASLPKKGKGRSKLSTYHPSLFVYEDCLLPRYEQLGRACLKENPLLRPTFEEVLRELEAIRGEWEGKANGEGGEQDADPSMARPPLPWLIPQMSEHDEALIQEEEEEEVQDKEVRLEII
jgi:hypothetical protein